MYFVVVYSPLVSIPCYANCVMYVRQLSLQQLLMWASYRDRLPEAILYIFVVVYKLIRLIMYC